MDLGVIGLHLPTQFIVQLLLILLVDLLLLHYFNFKVFGLNFLDFPFPEVWTDDLDALLHFLLLRDVQMVYHCYVLSLRLFLLIEEQVLHSEVLRLVFVNLLALDIAVGELPNKIFSKNATFPAHCSLLAQGSLFADFHFILYVSRKL